MPLVQLAIKLPPNDSLPIFFFFFSFFFIFFLLLHLFIYSFQHINKIIKYITCQNNHIRIVEATPVSEDPPPITQLIINI